MLKTPQHVSHVQLQSASACAVNLLACRRRLRSNSLSHVYLYQPVLYSVGVAFACVFCLLLFGLNVLRSRSVPSHKKSCASFAARVWPDRDHTFKRNLYNMRKTYKANKISKSKCFPLLGVYTNPFVKDLIHKKETGKSMRTRIDIRCPCNF